jgi:hypothetical protein
MRVSNTRVSQSTLCPLGQSKKAIGFVSQIGPCVATHSVDNRQACWFQKTNGAVTTVKWNHRGEEPFLAVYTRRRNRTLDLRKTTLGSRVRVQSWLNAEKIFRHRAEGEAFLLTFLFIGLVRVNQALAERQVVAGPEDNR